MDKLILAISAWVLLVGGLIGMVVALIGLFSGKPVTDLALLGATSGFRILAAGVVAFLRTKT